jgi:glycosyltransferase involved in cell wall biosynthesis
MITVHIPAFTRFLTTIATFDRKIFFLYPENTLAYLDFEIPSSVTVIATFHQPLNYFENLIFDCDKNINKIKNFKRCDKAIILEKNSVNNFSKLLEIPQVKFIPHGINLNIFQPNPKLLRKSRSILFLGNWLRDFEFAARVFQELVNKNHDIEINIIVNKRNANHFYKINNVNIYTNLSDEQLIKLLQTQPLLFLPLLSATANNAILEAAASGLPIMTTKHFSTFDYFSKDSIFVFSLDNHNHSEFIVDEICKLLNNPEILFKLSQNAQSDVQKIAWESIASEVISFIAS